MSEQYLTLHTLPIRSALQGASALVVDCGELEGIPPSAKPLHLSRVSDGRITVTRRYQVSQQDIDHATLWQNYSGRLFSIRVPSACQPRPTATPGLHYGLIVELIEKLVHLKGKSGQMDDGEYLPSEFAYRGAVASLSAAYAILGVTFSGFSKVPLPSLSADSDGAVRCRWLVRDRELRANFAGEPSLRSYLYHESGSNFEAEELNPNTLAHRLAWLME